MLRAAAKLLLLIALVLPVSAAPRFAIVRVGDIYRNLQSTQNLQKELQTDRDNITKDERGVNLRNKVAELQELQKQFQAMRDRPMDESIRAMARDFEIKRQEAQTLQEEYEAFGREKTKDINIKLVTSMRSSLNKIADASRRIAKEQGFDGAFDSSGASNSGVPALLYTKNAKDITDEVVAALKDAGEPSISGEAPAGEAANPIPSPAPAPAKP